MMTTPRKRLVKKHLGAGVGGCLAGILLSLFAAGCMYNNPAPAVPITLIWTDATTGQISPAPTFQFALSTPVADTSADFVISPPTAANYSVHFNATRDTITLDFLDMLQGNTRYVFTLKSPLHSSAGAWLYPYQDSVSFTTAACEQEPNETFALADTLTSKSIYGMISNADDTDTYVVPAVVAPGKFFISSLAARDTFLVFDSLERGVSVSQSVSSLDTFAVPALAGHLAYVKVFSYVKGTVGMYKFGIVQQ
jgi:hypothetical protein